MPVKINNALVKNRGLVAIGGRFSSIISGPLSQGPNNGGNVSVFTSGDFSFTNLNNVLGDSAYAQGVNNIEAGISDQIKISNFGFSIPSNSIDGVEITFTAYCIPSLSLSIGGFDLYYESTNTFYGSDTNLTTLSSTPTVYTYGGPTYKWNNWGGQNITNDIINNSTFSVITYVTGDIGTVYLKNIKVKVYYS